MIPNITIIPRYASDQNFVGKVVEGYLAPKIILSVKAAVAVREAQNILNNLGYKLVVYDGYRPQKAVNRFFEFFQ